MYNLQYNEKKSVKKYYLVKNNTILFCPKAK